MVEDLSNGLTLPSDTNPVDYLAVTGSLFTIAGFSLFCFTLVLHAAGVRYGRARDEH